MKITDDLNELFDVVDENDKVIGKATRREAHKNKNLIHRSIGVVIFNNKGKLFLQQRSTTKDTDPLKWTISCSGHVGVGDVYKETAIRELKEELGLEISKKKYEDLEPVCKFICRAPGESEMSMLFRLRVGPGVKFRLNKDEIAQGKFFTQNKLTSQVVSGKIKLSFMGKMALEKIGWVF